MRFACAQPGLVYVDLSIFWIYPPPSNSHHHDYKTCVGLGIFINLHIWLESWVGGVGGRSKWYNLQTLQRIIYYSSDSFMLIFISILTKCSYFSQISCMYIWFRVPCCHPPPPPWYGSPPPPPIPHAFCTRHCSETYISILLHARRCSETHIFILLDEPSRRIRWVDRAKLWRNANFKLQEWLRAVYRTLQCSANGIIYIYISMYIHIHKHQ